VHSTQNAEKAVWTSPLIQFISPHTYKHNILRQHTLILCTYYCERVIFLLIKPYRWCIVSVLVSSVVDRRLEPRSGQNNDYIISICCFSAKHTALRSRIMFPEWGDMFTRGLLFQWASTLISNSACWSSTKRISSSSDWKLTRSRHDVVEIPNLLRVIQEKFLSDL
jgi:hypothetical protein